MSNSNDQPVSQTISPSDFARIADACREEAARNGIQVRPGRRYVTVAVRIEIVRRILGAIGIETKILSAGDPVLVRAEIRDQHGRLLATGHAEEVRSGRGINATSALENAETSAVGRALAVLGAHGGEFASADELATALARERAVGKPAQPEQTAARNVQTKPDRDPIAIRDALIERVVGAQTIDEVDRVVAGQKFARALDWLRANHPEIRRQVQTEIDRRRAEIVPVDDSVPF